MDPAEGFNVTSPGFSHTEAIKWSILSEALTPARKSVSYFQSFFFKSRLWGCKKFTCKLEAERDIGVCEVWMPCRHALGFVVETDGNEFQSELMRADPYLAPYRGIQVTFAQKLRKSPSLRSPPSREVALIADSGPERTERITSRPTFENLFELFSSAIGTALKRAVFPVDKQNQRGTPPSHSTLQICYPICPTSSGLTTLSSFDHTADTGSFMLWGT